MGTCAIMQDTKISQSTTYNAPVTDLGTHIKKVLCIRFRIQRTRYFYFPWYHLNLPLSHDCGLFKCQTTLLFYDGNTRCSLLKMPCSVHCSQDEFGSVFPFASHQPATLSRFHPYLLVPAQTHLFFIDFDILDFTALS